MIEDELPRLEEFVSAGDLANCYAGMSAEQIAELAGDPLFSIGIHTVDHPLLDQVRAAQALRQIQDNRAWIEEPAVTPVTGSPTRAETMTGR